MTKRDREDHDNRIEGARVTRNLVASHPKVAEVDAKIEDLRRRRERAEHELAESGEAYRLELEAQRAAASDFLLSGGVGEVPVAPMPRFSAEVEADTRAAFYREEQELNRARTVAVAGVYDEIVSDVQRQAAEITAEALPHIAALEALLQRSVLLLAAIREVRGARNDLSAETSAGRLRYVDGTLGDVVGLVQVIQAGLDVDDVIDLDGRGARHQGSRQLGFQNDQLIRMTEARNAPEPPLPPRLEVQQAEFHKQLRTRARG